jgi:hypothetical protein
MGRNDNVNRPYVRRVRGGGQSGGPSGTAGSGANSARELRSYAGLTERATVEQLERRQMLFSLTVTADDVDPATGLGSVSALFGYYIPYLSPVQEVTPRDPQTQGEGFDQANYGPINSGFRFQESGLSLVHNVNPGGDMVITAAPQTQDNQERFVRARLNDINEFISFRFFEQGNTNANAPRIAVTQFNMEVGTDPTSVGGDTNGLVVGNTRVDLLIRNSIVASFTGAALANLFAGPGGPNGVGTLNLVGTETNPGFDEVRITLISPVPTGINTAFTLDNVSYTIPGGTFSQVVTNRAFGAVAAISGPVGATVTVLDLYGRDMLRNAAVVSTGQANPGDADDDGRPAYNEGIGSIRFSGTDSRTSFVMTGYLVSSAPEPPDGANVGLVPRIGYDFFTGTVFRIVDATVGNYDDFEAGGFGFLAEVNNGQFDIGGLPPGVGSVVIGSPFIRDITSPDTYNAIGFALDAQGLPIQEVTSGFTRADQGLFLTDGSSIGSVTINGMLFGSSRFNGFVDRLSVGTLYGSVTVEGDLGTFVVASDAGIWSPEPDFRFNDGRQLDPNNKTNGQLIVGRTAGQILIGARSQLDVTIVGDVSSPQTRPARDSTIYYEQEAYANIDPAAERAEAFARVFSNVVLNNQTASDLGRSGGQGVLFNAGFLRNDSILNSEVVNSGSAGVRIKGEVSQRDPFNGDDEADVYAFAVDGTGTINIQGTVANNSNIGANPASIYFRVMNADGDVVAAPDAAVRAGRFVATNLNFIPNAPGIYYLVVSDPQGNQETGAGGTPYTISLNGLATATLGAYRTGAGQGFTDQANGLGSSLTVLSGNIGSLRLGTGFITGAGTDGDPTGVSNTTQDADSSMSWQGGSISTPGSIYNITTGSDVGPADGFSTSVAAISVTAGGDLGSLITGLSPLFGGGVGGNSGDVNFLTLNIGGRIGMIDVRGGVGLDQDPEGAERRQLLGVNSLNVFTGRSGGNGDIGMIRVAWHVVGDSMNITTTPGSTVGALLVSQADSGTYDDPDTRSGIFAGDRGIRLNLGAGSDVRFADTPRIDLINGDNTRYPLIGGRAVELIDDSGAAFQVLVDGLAGVLVGEITAMPVDGSQGVAVSKIAADLSNGGRLRIIGGNQTSTGRVSIGHILVTGDGTSSIEISGTVEIDVWRIEERGTIGNPGGGGGGGGGGFVSIINTTPGGDIVAADVTALGQFSVDGSLGRTQVPAFGPQRIGPRLGITIAAGGDVGAPLGLANGLFDDSFNSSKVRRAVRDSDNRDGEAALDDIGSPFDQELNGLVVRGGGVQQVRARDALGDVLLLGQGSTLQLATANYDLISAFGSFEGVIGTIYATNIGRVDIGDGLQRPEPSPLATSGIFARNNLGDVASLRVDGTVRIEGPISASNETPDVNTTVADGINEIQFTGGRFRDAYIGVRDLDGFWNSFFYGDENRSRGDIGEINNTGGTFYGMLVVADDLDTIRLTNGFFDASEVLMTGEIGNISAQGYRNRSLTGSLDELRSNSIIGGRDIESITSVTDIDDLQIDIIGRVTTSITAVNFNRAAIDVDSELRQLTATGAFRASNVNTGQLTTFTAASVYASTFGVSGLIQAFNVSGTVQNTDIAVTGSDGGITGITVGNGLTGSISATGPIGAIVSTAGDIDLTVTTTTARGNVGAITAGRDLVLRTDVSGNVGTLTAGRNIGRRGESAAVVVRGDIAGVAVSNGALYSDIRSGGTITGTVTIGGAVSTPTDPGASTGSIISFGAIRSIVVGGDFGGNITSYSGGITSVAITNGSFLAGNTIAAFDGNIGSITITNGNLYGNIHADFDLTLLNVVAGADGIFGDIGVNPTLSSAVTYDARRNQLPPGVGEAVGIQGPSITAGRNIVRIGVTGGNVYEASFFAERSITGITVVGNIGNDTLTTGLGTYFAAGDAITSIAITGNVSNTSFIGGLVDLGSGQRPGGTGTAADTIKSGSITALAVTGRIENSTITAGMNAGADGVYATDDDTTAFGVSVVTTLTLGTVGSGVRVYGDTLSPAVANDARFVRGGTNLPNSNSTVFNPAVTTPPPGAVSFTGSRIFNIDGNSISITLTGGGNAIFVPTPGAPVLYVVNTTSASLLTIASTTGTINNLDIFGTDDGALGTLAISSVLTGDSDITIDGNITTINLARTESTGDIAIGGDVTTLAVAGLLGGQVSARAITTLTITGQFGNTNPAIVNEASISALSTGAISITGAARGVINVTRESTSLVTGASERSVFRFGGGVGNVTLASSRGTILAAGDSIGNVSVTGDFIDSTLATGLDLGTDAFFGGSGLAADTLSSGNIGAVSVGGSFAESDITAGFARGSDGFFGTSDDTVSAGRGVITSVTIGGTQVGSTRNTESYRIASNGSVGLVRVGGQVVTGAIGNFAIDVPRLVPNAAQVNSIDVTVANRQFTANLLFNQPIDFSSIPAALSVSEVRGNGNIEIRLIQGVDYTLSYNNATNSLGVIFSRTLTERNLPQVPDRPGPGIYRFELDEALFRARLTNIGLDGDGDNFAEQADEFSEDAIVGDAGDKLSAQVGSTVDALTNTTRRIDFYGPTNLNFVLDSNRTSDNLPDVNTQYTLRGFIGDHPDNDSNTFRFAGDVDVYSITLQAGQILRLGRMQGTATLAPRTILDPQQNGTGFIASIGAFLTSLPAPVGSDTDITFAESYLVTQTGTFFIVVGTPGTLTDASVNNPDQFPLRVGDYNFTIEVFDDGDSGFTSDTTAGNGTPIVQAPPASEFAGRDGVVGTADDIGEVVINGFRFTRDRSTGIVSGNNGVPSQDTYVTSTRDNAGNFTQVINSAIGPRGTAGVPTGNVTSDVDVYHLNNRLPIAPGTKMKVTLRLTQFGADLGQASPIDFSDNRGFVQFGLFDTTTSTTARDGLLVFSPTDFKPTGGTPNTLIADNGTSRYGYDANGDFFAEFITPSRLGGGEGQAGTFALYLQGVFNSDYQIEVVSGGTGVITKQTQNVLIETNGGSVNWLEAGGFTSNLGGFNIRTLGYVGNAANGLPVNDYVLQNLVASLNSIYQGAGLDVRFSTSASDFEFQPFSTVFLTSTSDPILAIYNSFSGAFNFDFQSTDFRSNQPYGVAEHSDPFNTDLTDEAVVFLPSFAIQGFGPGQAGLDSVVQSLSGAVSRRVGELMGLRIATDNTTAPFDSMAADAPENLPGSGAAFVISNTSRNLSNGFDSVNNINFFLGNQNQFSLLDRVLSRR